MANNYLTVHELNNLIKTNFPYVYRSCTFDNDIDVCNQVIDWFIKSCELEKNYEIVLKNRLFVSGGYFFKYKQPFETLMPELYKNFADNHHVDIFLGRSHEDKYINEKLENVLNKAPQAHFTFNSQQNIKEVNSTNLEAQLKNGTKIKYRLFWSNQDDWNVIIENFDLEPCQIAYIPCMNLFKINDFFRTPITTTKILDLYAKNQQEFKIYRVLKLLMKGFFTPIESSEEFSIQRNSI